MTQWAHSTCQLDFRFELVAEYAPVGPTGIFHQVTLVIIFGFVEVDAGTISVTLGPLNRPE
jgi:hypothetical protein